MSDDDIGAVSPLVHLVDAGVTVILYRLEDGYLYARTVRADGSLAPQQRVTDRAVVQSGSDSEQVGVDAIGFEGRVILTLIDEELGRWLAPDLRSEACKAGRLMALGVVVSALVSADPVRCPEASSKHPGHHLRDLPDSLPPTCG